MSRHERIRALFDVTHPAHVHLFKHAIRELERAGHEVLVTSRRKEVTIDLLDAYGIDHHPLTGKGTSKLGLALEWPLREVRLARLARAFEPDVILSHINPAAAHAARLSGGSSIVFNDEEPGWSLTGRLIQPFASVICTPAGFSRDLGPKQHRYDGFHELAYLHPGRFEPDPDRLRAAGVDPDDRYFVLRFVSWGAHHDVGQSGLSRAAKRELVSFLDRHGDVYVSTEGDLPASFAGHELPVSPDAIHHLLAFADLYVGDSQTMAIEAAVLGTPTIRSNSFAGTGQHGHMETLDEEYGLVISTGEEDHAVARAKELATDPTAAARWGTRRDRLLAESVDVTGFMLDRIAEQATGHPHWERVAIDT
jgi:hypothetical protein